MVLGILTAVAACPAIIGTTEAVRHGEQQNARERHRGRKYNLTVNLLKHSTYAAQFNGAPIVLRNHKLYVDTRRDTAADPTAPEYFPATINYLPYPGKKEEWREAGFRNGEGMVTLINDERYLNWVFVDRDTFEVKYGEREPAEPHLVGPWDCTAIDRRLTFRGWEGFIAVQEDDGDDMWALYFDCKDDGLTGEGQIGNKGKRMLEVEVSRKEVRRDFEAAFTERAERVSLRQGQGQQQQPPRTSLRSSLPQRRA